jgi:GNAT superfamily N-acetyltransferase
VKPDPVTSVRTPPARPDEAPALSALAMRSKAHWGYSAEFMQSCRASLTIKPAHCDGSSLLVAERDGQFVGFARVVGSPADGELSDLWVDPDAMGQGVGRTLFTAITQQARKLGFRSLRIDSDPNAETFYLHIGAVRIGETPSTAIPGRVLPLLSYEIPNPD